AGERHLEAVGGRLGVGEPGFAGVGQGKLVGPSRRRTAVVMLQDRLRLSQRRACQIVGQSRSLQRGLPSRPTRIGICEPACGASLQLIPAGDTAELTPCWPEKAWG